MTVRIGQFGVIRRFEDFLNFSSTTMATTDQQQAGVMYCSVNEGSFDQTIDEPGGILKCTTDTGDNDNIALFFAPVKAADGTAIIEARFKTDDATYSAIFLGFCTTLDATTPVCPIEYDGTTQTTGEAGSSIGMLMDAGDTDLVWSAVAGDNSAAATGSPTETTVACGDDQWQVARVEVNNAGGGRCFIAKDNEGLTLVKEFADGTFTESDVLYPVLIHENRTNAARTFEVDYMYAESGRDWTV